MPTDKLKNRSSVSNLTLLRFVAPSYAHPEGLVVAKGYPPFKPSVIGMSIHAD